jgi:hypothetical protein
MMDRNPPRLASWLLDKLGYLRQNAGLGGDLLEEFHSGRSHAWFWRQTAVVIATGIRLNASGLLRVFAILFALQALLDCSLWRSRGQIKMGNLDYPGFVGSLLVVGFFVFQLARRKPVGGIDAGAASLLYVIMAPWLYRAFPNEMSLTSRIAVDFLQLALTFVVAAIPPPLNSAGIPK